MAGTKYYHVLCSVINNICGHFMLKKRITQLFVLLL